ncbi:1-phosphatidylinositol 4,5-bisphosphate phosphodiesterase gamma-1-like [Dendronephthya gigantea]|uniref:1-phosphatidylinositol 4,5-bisphosphate phosphodiesterase gamma-1-like n=1 Tax=Dendronephthya gigantea TaxID=151771 RepID=UPI001068E93A|nr:1-phosphatidylinositol 4,5-bisphosphate phosphodiesterase gamma-1-like [Dendronephthya gigantea]
MLKRSLKNRLKTRESNSSISMDKIIGKMQEGMTMTRFYPSGKRKPENRVYYVNVERMLFYWTRPDRPVEGSVKIRDVKAIRRSTCSKDFEKNIDYLRRVDFNCCLVILYGTTFNLKTLSCVAQTAQECSYWVDGLTYLINMPIANPFVVSRWLQTEWNMLLPVNQNGITMKELKQFLLRSNVKMSVAEMTAKFQTISDVNNNAVIDFKGFKAFYESLMNHQTVGQYFYTLSKDRKNVLFKHFRSFLMMDQKETFAKNVETVRQHIVQYLGGDRGAEPYLSLPEFLDYIFSKTNSVFNEEHAKVYQDMTHPLSQYWIASSHNTYLTGNQLLSESSVEAYVRCLRMGCRCVELDCWDGPDNQPVIYHGKTITSKIKFSDVIRAIKENAFVASKYPLILSIENHCSNVQQRVMAQSFRDVFGDYLLTSPVNPSEGSLPSPEDLAYKIIIKNKKLAAVPTDQGTDDVLCDTAMDGILYLEDEFDKIWRPHFFVLSNNRLDWTEEQTDSEDQDDDENSYEEQPEEDEASYFALFHRGIDGVAATKLLQLYNKGNGSFLVRESSKGDNTYSISFWRNGCAQHCRIKTKQVDGETSYSLGETDSFVNLYSLVDFYQSHPLRTPQFEITLTEPISQPNAHLDKGWFHTSLTRDQAENMLMRAPQDGSFLVRKKETTEKNQEAFAISFKAEGKVKHCRIIQEGRLFTIGTAQFESLVELVDHYTKFPLYRKIKLKKPISAKMYEDTDLDPGEYDSDIYQDLYLNPTFATKPVCRALWDYTATGEGEMSFCMGAFITNVVKGDRGWWRGDFADYKQALFPANFCEEINVMTGVVNDSEGESSRPLGESQKGSMNVSNCKIEPLPPRGGLKMLIRITADGQKPLEVAAKSIQDMEAWVECIKSSSSQLNRQESKKTATIKVQPGEEKIDKMLSDLVVYCQTVPFDFEGIGTGKHYEMSSISESKIDKYTNPKNSARFNLYNHNQLTRVYPKGTRVDSTNYDPSMMWSCGVQMCALNYQTSDRPMQLNHGRFMDNGGCGYVLKPDCTRLENFDPYQPSMLEGVKAVTVNLTIIAGRHLPKIARGITSPFVEVEIIGAYYDTYKYKSKTQADNGLNPIYNETIEFDVICPPMAYIRFAVYDEDMFGDPNFVAQAVFPFKSLKLGYRSVPLKNAYNEDLELSSLLVYLDVFMDEDEDVYTNIHDLRNAMEKISTRIGEEASQITVHDEAEPSMSKMMMLDAEFREKQNQLQTLIEQRKEKKRGERSNTRSNTRTL